MGVADPARKGHWVHDRWAGDHIPQRCLHNFVLTGTPQSLCILDPSNLASLTHICVMCDVCV